MIDEGNAETVFTKLPRHRIGYRFKIGEQSNAAFERREFAESNG